MWRRSRRRSRRVSPRSTYISSTPGRVQHAAAQGPCPCCVRRGGVHRGGNPCLASHRRAGVHRHTADGRSRDDVPAERTHIGCASLSSSRPARPVRGGDDPRFLQHVTGPPAAAPPSVDADDSVTGVQYPILTRRHRGPHRGDPERGVVPPGRPDRAPPGPRARRHRVTAPREVGHDHAPTAVPGAEDTPRGRTPGVRGPSAPEHPLPAACRREHTAHGRHHRVGDVTERRHVRRPRRRGTRRRSGLHAAPPTRSPPNRPPCTCPGVTGVAVTA